MDACIPIDPELYVASQGMNSLMTDPWTGLTSAESVRRYKDRVDVIVRGLRDELTEEVRVAERRILAGQSVCQVLTSKSGRISVLGRYIVAVRASRERLARRFLEGAVEQHRACPLYRQAAAGLIPSTAYPIAEGHEVASPPDLRMVGILGRAIVYRN